MAFECTQCGACCTNLSAERWVLLFPSDLPRLAAGLGIDRATLLSDYAVAAEGLPALPVAPYRVAQADGRCVFLNAANRCGVHAFKPAQCRLGPEAFLSDSMRDYACMAGVPPQDDAAQIDALFAEFFAEET